MSEPHLGELVEVSARPPQEAAESKYDFTAAVSRYETPLLRYIGQILGRELGQETEDLVQEAFLRLHRQITRHGESSIRNTSSWLFRVAHNLALDAVRKRRRERRDRERAPDGAARELEEIKEGPDPLGEMIQREVSEKVLAELHKLPEQQEHILLLKIIQGMTLREIGDVVGISKSQVAERIKRGLGTLARRLKASGVT